MDLLHRLATMFELDYQIPVIDPNRYDGDYHEIPIDSTHPLFHEPLVRLDDFEVAYESHHARTDGKNWPYHRAVEGSRPEIWMRKTAAEKLARASGKLRAFGLELFILDGYHSIECHRGLWDFYYAEARRKKPGGSEIVWRNYAMQFVADPGPFDKSDPKTWHAHTTGGAVDLTLRDLRTGQVVDMGSRFEEISTVSYNDYFERRLAKGLIAKDDPRLWHRRLAHWAMQQEGFLNDPFVFWHYDWGNQLYVKTRTALFGNAPKAAWYGYIEAPKS
jgi:D-alanyl-D-alanine dipeptidase